jgi:hypothetical protein
MRNLSSPSKGRFREEPSPGRTHISPPKKPKKSKKLDPQGNFFDFFDFFGHPSSARGGPAGGVGRSSSHYPG